MPLYEYLCGDCNTKFEIRRPMMESDSPAACPECQSASVKRQISHVFSLVGTQVSDSATLSTQGCGCGGACGCGSHA